MVDALAPVPPRGANRFRRRRLDPPGGGGRVSSPRHKLAVALAVIVGGAVLAACSGGPSVSVLSETPTTTPGATISLEQSPVGPILATGKGFTLYDFKPDSPTHSACVNQSCVFLWPPLVEDGPVTLGKGLHRSLLGTVKRSDGSLQITYGGHPLYTFNADVKPGMVTGQALDQSGGPWYVVGPSGQQITTGFSVNR